MIALLVVMLGVTWLCHSVYRGYADYFVLTGMTYWAALADKWYWYRALLLLVDFVMIVLIAWRQLP